MPFQPNDFATYRCRHFDSACARCTAEVGDGSRRPRTTISYSGTPIILVSCRSSVETLAEEFEAQKQDVTVEHQGFETAQLDDQLQRAIQSGEGPDISQINNGENSMGPMVRAGLILPMDDYAETVRLERPPLPGPYRSQSLHRGWGDDRPGSALGRLVDRGDRGLLLQQADFRGQRGRDSRDLRRPRSRDANLQGRGRDAARLRQSRSMARDPPLRRDPRHHDDAGVPRRSDLPAGR